MKCLNCGTELRPDEPYCPQCGQAAKTGKLRFLPGIQEILYVVLNLDNNFLRTISGLLIRPGKLIVEFIEGRRARYFKPFGLLFVFATFYFVLFKLMFGHDPGISGYGEDNIEGVTAALKEFPVACQIVTHVFEILHNKAWLGIISITLYLLPLKLIFGRDKKGPRFTLAEYFYAMTYVQCQKLIIETLLLPVGFYDLEAMDGWGTTLALLYCLFTLRQMHGISWGRAIWRYILLTLSLILLIFITFFILIFAITLIYPKVIELPSNI